MKINIFTKYNTINKFRPPLSKTKFNGIFFLYLSELDKTCLKFAIIMHDIAKSEGVIDDAHPEMSALFARNILEKYQLPIEIKDRIFELIKYHHWL